jgi:hypothetical protein
MSKDQYVFLPLKFYDDRFEAHDNISVGLAAPITIVEFVFVTVGKIFGIGLLKCEKKIVPRLSSKKH